jgi:hypothetical protein
MARLSPANAGSRRLAGVSRHVLACNGRVFAASGRRRRAVAGVRWAVEPGHGT